MTGTSVRTILNPLQIAVFDALSSVRHSEWFYFTWGTALSECYLQHRVSVDVDLFSESEFRRSVAEEFATAVSGIRGVKIRDFEKVYDRFTIVAESAGTSSIVDIVRYPYPRLEKSGKTYRGFEVDSLRDIWTNKWAAVFDRREVKDVMDIACLVRSGEFDADERTLSSTCADLRRKFSLSCSPQSLVSQFRSRLSTTNPAAYRHLLYVPVGEFDVFKETFPKYAQ